MKRNENHPLIGEDSMKQYASTNSKNNQHVALDKVFSANKGHVRPLYCKPPPIPPWPFMNT